MIERKEEANMNWTRRELSGLKSHVLLSGKTKMFGENRFGSDNGMFCPLLPPTRSFSSVFHHFSTDLTPMNR
jgi:hypothetical protein